MKNKHVCSLTGAQLLRNSQSGDLTIINTITGKLNLSASDVSTV